MAEYGSIEAPEPQESFLGSEPTPVPAPRRKLYGLLAGLLILGTVSFYTSSSHGWSQLATVRQIPMEYEGTYQSGYEKGSYCKLTGCTGGYMCAQGGSLLTKFDSDNIDVRDDNYKTCQPENHHFDGGVRCTGAVNLPADTKDKCVKLVKPSTHGWWCCQYWDGEYHV